MYNNVVPKYYGEFRESVLRGEVPICKEIEAEMHRIDRLIADPKIYYDPKPVEGYIKFCEKELTLTDGTRWTVLPSFKLWAEQLLGWYYYEDVVTLMRDSDGRTRYGRKTVRRRLTKKQYLIVARGTAKTMYEMSMQAYFLTLSAKTTHQITVAPTMKQAEEVLIPFRTAIIRTVGPLFRFLTSGAKFNTRGPIEDKPKLLSTKKGIENTILGSLLEIRPMTVGKLQGLRPFLSTIDEWLSTDVREDVVGAIEQGASKLRDYIIIAVSSEGTYRNGSGDDIKIELKKILNGEIDAPHVSIFHYKLDDVSEVGIPDLWPKANPNLGLTVSFDTYARDVRRAEQVPHARNDILAKRFGLPMEGYTYFFTYEETLPQKHRSFGGNLAALGIDLSQGDDFCSFAFLYDLRDGSFGLESLSFITSKTLLKLPPALRYKYDEFIAEGSLRVLEGSIIDPDVLYREFDEYIIEKQIDIGSVGYDPYGAVAFIKRYIQENTEYCVDRVPQTYATLSVPLGELKDLMEDRAILFSQKIITYTMGNAMVMKDTNGNQRLYKRKAEHKIDVVAALVDAWVSRRNNPDAFV